MTDFAGVRNLPAQDQRVETGPVRFGGDWPGVFIRGDSAAAHAGVLQDVILRGGSPIARVWLAGLYNTLRSCFEGDAKAISHCMTARRVTSVKPCPRKYRDEAACVIPRVLAGVRLAAMAVSLWQMWAFLSGGHSLIAAAVLRGVPSANNLHAAWWLFTRADVLPLPALGALTLAVFVGLFLPFCAVYWLAVSSLDPGKAMARHGNGVKQPNQQVLAGRWR